MRLLPLLFSVFITSSHPPPSNQDIDPCGENLSFIYLELCLDRKLQRIPIHEWPNMDHKIMSWACCFTKTYPELRYIHHSGYRRGSCNWQDWTESKPEEPLSRFRHKHRDEPEELEKAANCSHNPPFLHPKNHVPLPSKGGSLHHCHKALDFRTHSYEKKSEGEKLRTWLCSLEKLEDFLRDKGIEEEIGLGIYPEMIVKNGKNISPSFANPFFHWDSRGRKARWCRFYRQGQDPLARRTLIYRYSYNDCIKKVKRRLHHLGEDYYCH